MERIERAYQHRLYLIEERMIGSPPTGSEFVVLGATGNVYSVKVEQRPSCTCPDAAKGNTCKHLLFVMLRVLKLSPSDPRAWQTALLTSELQDLLTISATNEGILASQTVRQRFHELSGFSSSLYACLFLLHAIDIYYLNIQMPDPKFLLYRINVV